jgi:hypothetical protein
MISCAAGKGDRSIESRELLAQQQPAFGEDKAADLERFLEPGWPAEREEDRKAANVEQGKVISGSARWACATATVLYPSPSLWLCGSWVGTSPQSLSTVSLMRASGGIATDS